MYNDIQCCRYIYIYNIFYVYIWEGELWGSVSGYLEFFKNLALHTNLLLWEQEKEVVIGTVQVKVSE